MTELSYEPFITSILATLEKNGYPTKRVALPLERMYEVAHEKGLNFNKALTMLGERGVDHEKGTERIIFFPKAEVAKSSMEDMMAEAQRVVSSMSPDEMQKLMTMYQNMTPEQQSEIHKKAKDLGLG
jgi:hypothetical protein